MVSRRRLLFLLIPALCFFLLAVSLYFGRDQLTHIPLLSDGLAGSEEHPSQDSSSVLGEASPTPSSSKDHPSATPAISSGNILSAEQIAPYIDSILNSSSTALPRLSCPAIDAVRYAPLQADSSRNAHIDLFFALDLRNCIALLPRLLGSIIEAIKFIGPSRCALSIVEGHSDDGTGDVLSALVPFLSQLGVEYTYQSSDIDPSKGERINRLAALRNLALEPLLSLPPDRASEDTTVLFANDVAACTEDVLELALQRRSLEADMVCGMDWTFVGQDPTFYDVWVARTLSGDSFFDIPPDGSWNNAWNLFWNDAGTKERFVNHIPFQVFACWNGATAIGARPLLDGLRFRGANTDADECSQGEPQIFSKELWYRGYRKIAVVPSVNLEYSDEKSEKIKELKGFTSQWAKGQTAEENSIDWVDEPPEKVKCMPTWEHQFWRPWNETLGVA